MGLVLVALILLAAIMGNGSLRSGFTTSSRQLMGFLPVIIIAILIAGFTEVLLPKGFVERWLSDSSGWRGLAVAWAAGIITPGGSIVGMPIIAGLYKSGVGLAALMTYATSLATLSILRIPLEAGFYGWRVTMIRVGVSIILPFVAGGTTLFVVRLLKSG